ncbi:MAG: acyl-CoA thioesterase [Nodosilinea sp.]
MDSCFWFEYGVTVQPHHTDYAGIVWHGTYVSWMEEARIAYLKARGITFADWINAGVDLPVVNLALRYRQSLALGEEALIKVRFETPRGVRMVCHYAIQNRQTQATCTEGQVILVPVDVKTRKVLRRLPEHLRVALE